MIKAIAFDWGNTIMREIPLTRRPSARSPLVEVVPGVTQALQDLQQSYLCCIASNARGPEAGALGLVLERVGLDQYFRHTFTTEELGFEKPDAKFFSGLLQRLKLQPYECIMVGDDYQVDICGAKDLGMKTIWITEHPGTLAGNADVVISSMSELVPAVNKLAAQSTRVTMRAGRY